MSVAVCGLESVQRQRKKEREKITGLCETKQTVRQAELG